MLPNIQAMLVKNKNSFSFVISLLNCQKFVSDINSKNIWIN